MVIKKRLVADIARNQEFIPGHTDRPIFDSRADSISRDRELLRELTSC